jgi:erythromycin esterase-like protein
MDTLIDILKEHAEPAPDLDSAEFAALFDRYGDAQVVLIGEASHGTHEFYQARAAITRQLIAYHGFTIVAFSRFPTWMWRNRDVQVFARWLFEFNQTRTASQRAEFRGLDVYSLRSSIREVLGYLQDTDPTMAREARERYACLMPWHDESALYGHFTEVGGMANCESAVLEQLQALLSQRLNLIENDGEALFNATRNARVVHAAEQYYRAMYRGNRESWNLRDRHMFETLQASLGQLCRETYGADAVLWCRARRIARGFVPALAEARHRRGLPTADRAAKPLLRSRPERTI